MSKRDDPFDWSVFIPHIVNPTKVLVIEALHCIGRPLSATDLVNVLDDGELTVPRIAYYVRTLTEDKVLTMVWKRKVRGATEKFYFFAPRA